jgi:translocation and assembly module TamB
MRKVEQPVDEESPEVRRRPVKRLIALALLVVLFLALLILWIQRIPIASDYIDDELDRRGVRATYELKRVGFRTQRLENLVIGDPARPDLTARWVEVRLGWRFAFSRPKVELITARGVRLDARLVRGRIRLGEVDKLLPPPTGLPFRFPEQTVDIADASVRFDTPAGRIGLAVEGKGRLSDGFRGRMAASAPALDLGGCGLARARGLWRVSIDRLRPRFQGPAQAVRFACGNSLAVDRLGLDLDLRLAEALDSWTGRSQVRAARLTAGGDVATGLAGRVWFQGDHSLTRGGLDLASAAARVAGLTVNRAAVEGRYALSLDSGAFTLLADASARGAAGGAGTLRPVIEALRSAGGTPLEPIGDSLATSLSRALRGFDATASLRLVSGRGYGGVRFERLAATGRSGARLSLGGGSGFTYYWPSGLTRTDGDLSISGGGFPTIRLSLDQARPGGSIRGLARVQPMHAGRARLALGDIRFDAAPGGVTRLATLATIDGPVEDGWVEGLAVPIAGRLDGRRGFAFGEGCTPARFRGLRINTLRLGPTSLPLCPVGRALVWKAPGGPIQGGAKIARPRFAGTLGASPLLVTSSWLRFALAGPSFTSSDVAVRLGREGAVNRLDLASFSGNFGVRGVAGRFSGLAAKLAAVPLLMTDGAGTWRVKGGDLSLLGAMTVSDEMQPPRFWPLVTRDFALALADNRIRAGGWLDDPETGTRIVRADIAHDLSTGRGRASLDVPGIRFARGGYQPEQLTRLTTGVVALVEGIFKGEGEIAWDERGTRSTGTFGTDDMDLAATFGPVEGLSTSIHFTDLLGLVSASGQVAETDLIRTGIDVLDGRIRYQLLPGLRVRVESGRWPFAGGELFLEETVLDFSKPSTKRLVFRVVGLDAARFVQQMEFSNISATGTFDGVIPMVFDERGGRIVDGRLTARAEGGTLSYIGELSDKDLGPYGKLAFDALKALRYSKLDIVLNGALDGEFVAAIELDGVARDPVLTEAPRLGGIKGLVAGRALSQLARIPFEFNIQVRGPFRSLIATMRSFEDPTNLIQSVLPEKLRAQEETLKTPVQPQESEIVR